MNRATVVLIAVTLMSLAVRAVADESVTAYLHDIKPLLQERCFACHGALKQESGLRLDTAALIRQGGDGGPVVVPGEIEQSVLIERIEADEFDGRMPPEGKPLAPEEIARLRAWVAAGAVGPEDERPEEDPQDHWSFRTPMRPEPPQVEGLSAENNPIDAFLLARLKSEQLTPRPRAEKRVLLRRLYLDLIGVPPTREELYAFLADRSPTAWTKEVNRLLDDPRYGERWGRHWMDIWRYSDWYGRRSEPDVWNSAPQIWRWRDWIVESLNSDKGYDQMVVQMLAADEVCPEDREAGYATGYLIRNWYALNPNDWMRSNVEHVGKAFLGLTFNCAHCHDHKYDPITHDDYFGLRAFFEPIAIRQERVPGEADPGPFQEYEYSKLRTVQRLGAVRIFDKNPDAPTWFYTGGDERNRVESRGSIPPDLPDFLSDSSLEIEQVQLPPRAWYPGLQPEIQQTVLDEVTATLSAAERELAAIQQTPTEPSSEAQQKLAQAEAACESAAEQARRSGQPGALAGELSLVLDATGGRRIVQNQAHLQQVELLPEGSRFDFELQILADAHVNFQLAKDVAKGLTACFVAFDQGRILAYQPGGFAEFEVGRYDFAAGQRRFHVTLVLQTTADRCLLTVRSASDDKVLAEAVPVALNGWNPAGDDTKGIAFDARTGAVVVLDDVTLTAPAPVDAAADAQGERLLSFDFEPPQYTDGQDVVGVQGFIDSSWNAAPAHSYVSATAANDQLQGLREQVEAARRALRSATLPREAAEAGVAAAKAQVASVQARIAADQAKHGDASEADRAALARTAGLVEREAAHLQACADALTQERALLEAETQPADNEKRTEQIQAATAALAQARARVESTRSAVASGRGSEVYTPLSPIYPRTSTGRRRALAEWITSPHNPLTARVAVNHIWTRHFHVPLVSTVYDFGRNGSPPSHPQLLDWLAVELMESGWSMKHIHRLILTSQAWQRVSSTGEATANAAADPENRLLWRMNTGRMEAEVLRDSLLYCARELDFTMGGQELENDQALTTRRRSLYYCVFPEDGGASELGQLFDAPDPLECYRRTETIVPQQALALTNSELVHVLSDTIVGDWEAKIESDAQVSGGARALEQRFVVEMFERILARLPTAAEVQICREALGQQRQLLRAANASRCQSRARASVVRALLNHNDFVTIR